MKPLPLFIFTLLFNSVWAQVLTFTRIYNNGQIAYSIIQLEDGSFMLSTGHASYSVIQLMKTDKDGNFIWFKTYKDTARHAEFALAQLKNKNIVITGYAYATDGTPYYPYVMCLDTSGNILWKRKFDGYYGMEIIAAADGGMIYSGAKIYDGLDGHVIKLDENGNILWTRIFGTDGYEYIKEMVELDDGSILCYGFSYDYVKGCVFLLKLDANGNVLWKRFYKFNNEAAASRMLVYCDGSILASGFRRVDIDFTHELEPFILKTDPDGNISWCKYYPNTNWGATIEGMVPDKQGHFILNYVLNNAGGLITSAFVTLDENGNVESAKAYPNLMDDFIPTLDNGFAASGTGRENISFGGFTLMKFDQNMYIPCTDTTFEIFVHDTIPFDTVMGRDFTGGIATDFPMQQYDTFFADTIVCIDTVFPGEIILHGCYDKHDSLFIPNIFTPNNDGLNETFKIFFNAEVVSFKLHIYNRWGNEVFSSNDLNTSWDGKSENGSECVEGTYYYILNLNEYRRRGYLILKK